MGRTLIAELMQHGHHVLALARSDNAEGIVRNLGADVFRGDLWCPTGLDGALRGYDAVFHAAAKVGDWGDLREFHRVNVAGTQALVDAARAADVPRFAHVSTEAVLADGRPIVNADETRPYPARPLPPYASTKALAERLVLEQNGAGLKTVAVRPRFVWGRGDTTVLPRLAESAKHGLPVFIGDGAYLTSTCHVRNLVHALLLAAGRGRGGAAYFVTDGPPLLVRDLVTALLATEGLTPPKTRLPIWAARATAGLSQALWRTAPLPGDPPLTRTGLALLGQQVTVSDEKAWQELGYRPVLSREEGLADMRRYVPRRSSPA